MSEVTLTLKEPIAIPVEADVIRPDVFLEKSRQEIEALPLYHGNRQRKLGELFEVQGERSDQIRIKGDLSRVKKIGYGMTRGRIIIEGDVGMHLGALMQGGEIIVEGNVSDWLGAEMKGGLIWVKGNAGNFVGAGYWGSKRGMNRGVIIIEGNAGNEVGAHMRRGLIVILGNAGDFVGANMRAGTVIAFGKVGEGPGIGMRRGTIVLFQDGEGVASSPQLLPTFHYDCTYNPTFLRVYLRSLRRYGIRVKEEYITGKYRRFNGDIAELGKGEILIYER
ncbi:MAG: formylmethanofuran dehydrogenase subunit C [Chloroflexi bacterium]|nr:MAG: formylmethanofuran dehydrogenase subunit C [Chloroflexota bacterium]